MRKYRVFVSETAVRQLRALQVKTRTRIKEALAELEDDPFRPRPKGDIKRLSRPHRDYFRLIVGNYRVIYVVEGQRVLVAKIIPRSEGYDWL